MVSGRWLAYGGRMASRRRLVKSILVLAALLMTGCGSSSADQPAPQQTGQSEAEAAAKADAVVEETSAGRAMRRAIESGEIDERMEPCDYPEWLREEIHLDQQLAEAGQTC